MNLWALGCVIVSLLWLVWHLTKAIMEEDYSHTMDSITWGLSLICSSMLLY